MDSITIPQQYLTILISIILLSMPTIITFTSACNNTSTTNNVPSNSNSIHENTTTKNDSTQTNLQNQKTTSYYKTYIKTECNTTTYPTICYQSLNPYATKIQADPLKLCNTSLSLALKAARSASSAVSKILKSKNMTETAKEVVHNCFGYLKESIGEMQDSLNEMSHLEDSSYDVENREFTMSNIRTWVSAAITYDSTCSDEFDEENVDASLRDKIRKDVLNVARMTSNALYFINNLRY